MADGTIDIAFEEICLLWASTFRSDAHMTFHYN